MRTRPPACWSVLPFSRTVAFIVTCRASWPAIVRVCPGSFISKSTSNSFAGACSWPSCFSASLRASAASFSAFARCSSIRFLSSAKVVTVYVFFFTSRS